MVDRGHVKQRPFCRSQIKGKIARFSQIIERKDR